MSERKHEDWIQAYLNYSSYSEAPTKFHFWTGVSVLAGALRRHVWISQPFFQWTPNFYIVFVAPPGVVSKSTTMNIGMNLLREVPGITFGPSAITWQSLISSLAASREEFYVPDDDTVHNMSAVTIAVGEFGTFLDPSNKDMVDMLVTLWDGQVGNFEKATKTQGSDTVVNPWINLISCTTPSWIAGNFPEYMIGGGFTSRTIFVYADQKRQQIAYPADVIPENFRQMQQDLIHDLEHIATNLKGEYKLSAEAKEWGREWYESLSDELQRARLDERLAGYLIRKQTHVHKLAMVLAAGKRDELVIELADLQGAEQLVTALEEDSPKVFGQIAAREARSTNRVVEMVQELGSVSVTSLYRRMFQSISYNEFSEAWQGAVKGGVLTYRKEGNEVILHPVKGGN